MTMQRTYSDARAHLRELLDHAGDDCETVIITRRDGRDVALVAADELRSLEETAHLFRSPANGQRLVDAMARAESGSLIPMNIEELRATIGLPDQLVAARR